MQVGTCHSPDSKYLKAEKGPTRLHSLKCKLSIKVCEALLSPPASPLWALYPVIPPPHLIYVSLLCAPVIPRISLRALIILYVITYLIIHFLHHQTLSLTIAEFCLSCLLASMSMERTRCLRNKWINKLFWHVCMWRQGWGLSCFSSNTSKDGWPLQFSSRQLNLTNTYYWVFIMLYWACHRVGEDKASALKTTALN